MVNAGLAGAIRRLRTQNRLGSWELGTNQTPRWTVDDKITSQPMPSSRQFWCQVNRQVRSGFYFQRSDSDSTNTICPPAHPPASGILTGMPMACGETILTTVCISGTRWQSQLPSPVRPPACCVCCACSHYTDTQQNIFPPLHLQRLPGLSGPGATGPRALRREVGCIGLEHRGFLTGVVTHLFHVCREHNFHRALAPPSCADDTKSMTGAGRKKYVVLTFARN